MSKAKPKNLNNDWKERLIRRRSFLCRPPTLNARFSSPTSINTGSLQINLDGANLSHSATVTQGGFIWTVSPALAQGSHRVTVTISNSAGSASKPWNFTVDTISPTVTITAVPGAERNLGVTWNGTDSGSGIANYTVQYRVGSSITWTGWLTNVTYTSTTFAGTPNYTYTFQVKATDLAGNSALAQTGAVKVESVTKYYSFGAQRVAMRRGSVVYYLHGDHLGSTSLTTDASGTKFTEARYLPYGETRWGGSGPTDFGFTGQRNDSFGLMDYNARFYSPFLGRFVSPDTIVPNPVNPQGFNRYSYVKNNPLTYNDPSGHCEVLCWTIIALVVGYTAYDYLSQPDIAYSDTPEMAAMDLPPSDLPGNDEALCYYCRDLQEGAYGAAIIKGVIEATPIDEIPGAKRLIGAVSEKAGKLLSTLNPKQRGPVLTGVIDTQTGEIFFGTNQKAIPENLHPILAERLERLNDYLGAGGWDLHYPNVAPGTHSEIYALSEALYAREARLGRAVTEDELGEFLLHNRWLQGTRAGTGVPPRCGNCEVLTEGVTIVE